ncbi:hypothetical protein ACWS7L_07620 [Exiguobacterium artemiae]
MQENADWEWMCQLGIATCTNREGHVIYTVTYEAAKQLYGKRMSIQHFNNCLDERGLKGHEHLRRHERNRRRRHPLA